MGSSVSPLTMRASCPSSPSWRGCALLRSKLPTSQVQHCNYHHHLGSLKRAPHVSPVHTGGHLRPRPRGQGKGRHVEHSRKKPNFKSSKHKIQCCYTPPDTQLTSGHKENLFCDSCCY